MKEIDIPPEIAEGVRKDASVKAQALKNATVKVFHAYNYSGPTTVEAVAIAKIVAVEVEFTGYAERFKLWDVDIEDAYSGQSFGSDAEVAFLDANGKFVTFDSSSKAIEFGNKPLRVILVFAVLKETKAVKLRYWGQMLTPMPIVLEDSGMQLPKQK